MTTQTELLDEALTWADVYADDAYTAGRPLADAEARMIRRFDDLGPDGSERLSRRYRPRVLRQLRAQYARWELSSQT